MYAAIQKNLKMFCHLKSEQKVFSKTQKLVYKLNVAELE